MYVAGGVILSLRLYVNDLPVLAVPGQLPKEFLISIGLSQVVLPSLGVAALYLVYRLVRGFDRAPELVPWALQSRFTKARTVALSAWLAALMHVPGLAIATYQGQLGSAKSTAAILVAFAVLWMFAWLVLESRARLSRRDVDWNGWLAVGAMVALAAACGVAASIPAATALPLLKSGVCTGGAAPLSGVLIGETGDRVYLGVEAPDRIVAVPRARAGELFVGGSGRGECTLRASAPG